MEYLNKLKIILCKLFFQIIIQKKKNNLEKIYV